MYLVSFWILSCLDFWACYTDFFISIDTPEIFWSEPALQPMYTAIREYLEIPQRAQILNDRLRVISDLLSMLRDHLTNFGVEYQTLIIIYLIIVAVIVACVSFSLLYFFFLLLFTHFLFCISLKLVSRFYNHSILFIK